MKLAIVKKREEKIQRKKIEKTGVKLLVVRESCGVNALDATVLQLTMMFLALRKRSTKAGIDSWDERRRTK